MDEVCKVCNKEVFTLIGGRCLECWDGPREVEEN
jgi:hypothetical protein